MEVKEAKEKNHLDNIETVKVAEYDLQLKNRSISFAFICNVLHEITDLGRYLGEIQRILTDKGRLAVIEWEKKDSRLGPPIDHRIDKTELIALCIKNGFETIDCWHIGSEYYSILLEKLNGSV